MEVSDKVQALAALTPGRNCVPAQQEVEWAPKAV